MPSETMNRREGACTCSASQPLDGNDATELARRNIGAPARCVRSSAARARRFWRRRSSRWEDAAKNDAVGKTSNPSGGQSQTSGPAYERPGLALVPVRPSGGRRRKRREHRRFEPGERLRGRLGNCINPAQISNFV